MIAGLLDLLRPFAGLLLPLIFIGFFLVTAIALRWSDTTHVRRAYLAGFLLSLIVFQTVMPVYVTPFMNWHKFSEPRPIETSSYEFRIVDANGNEIEWDRKSTLAFHGISPDIPRRAVEEYDAETRDEVAAWLLSRAQQYRDEVERGHPTRGAEPPDILERPHRLYRFPAHSLSGWTADAVDDLAPFVGVRVYRVNTTTSPDGAGIVDESETLVYETYPEDENATASDDVR